MDIERSREIIKYFSDEHERKNTYMLHVLLRNALNKSTNAAFYVEGKLRLLFINKTIQHRGDFQRAGLTTKAFPEIQSDCLMGAAERLAMELAGPRKQGIFLTVYTTIEGQKIPIEISYSFVEHEGEKVGLCFIRDIEGIIRGMDSIDCQEVAFRALADNSADYICRHDLEGRIVYVNKIAGKLIGLPAECILDKCIAELVPGAESEKYMDALHRVASTGTSSVAEMEFQGSTQEGGRHYLMRLVSECMPEGEITGVMVVGREVTDHSRLESELIKADKLESMSLFSSCVAHDFNNMLNVIMWSLSKMSNEPVNDLNRRIGDATEACQEAIELSRRLMSYAKGISTVRNPVVLDPIIRDSISMQSKHIRVELDLAEDLAIIEADEVQLRQMFGNLILNAHEAMHEDGGTLRIKAENVKVGQQAHPELIKSPYVMISFSDNGCGIDKDVLPKIFEPYFTTKTKGTGLGLTSCYLIVANHGGKIFVTSTLGVGSEFTVYLPVSSCRLY